MVGKWSVKNPLTLEERIKIKEALDLGMSYREMAEYVKRGKTTVKRESKRLGAIEMYDPKKAQSDFETKQKISKEKISETCKRNAKRLGLPKKLKSAKAKTIYFPNEKISVKHIEDIFKTAKEEQ